MPFLKASLVAVIVGWSTCAHAECPSFRLDKTDDVARDLLSRYAIVFTATIVKTRYIGKWTGTERLPIEEDYEIIDRIQGEMPSRTTLRMPCIDEFDCVEAPKAMAEYVKNRAGHKLVVLANRQNDASGHVVLEASVCPLLFDTDLSSRRGQALAAAMKRMTSSH